MTRKGIVNVAGVVTLAVLTGVATVFGERIGDMFMPASAGASSPGTSPAAEPGGSIATVEYPNAMELTARPRVGAWGQGESARSLAADSLRRVTDGLKLPREMAATRIDYQIADVVPGGQGRKRTASLEILLEDDARGSARCGPETFAFRDSGDLAEQITDRLNAIVFESYMGEKMTCG
ncbi:hypothetical protein [Qipengyuania sp. MTN3-11]|uniref:hypothetical protein n=1 Tax=Qipengyuania sp. MTN3-11 TaxID=3056557 RepID=UPI0036F403E0